MPQPGFGEQVASLNATLVAIEERVSSGEIPVEALTDFKSSVDDLRLRLWGLVSAGSANDYRGFQERFRLRRAKEICHGLENDLRSGSISLRHEELALVGQAARDLARAVASLAR
ncbi:MAG TPA: hypothetical protein VHR41_01885 [Gemmatimonadales bacterium]|jgi:hypothetical protein|nr:hypothetical protein [Gemmatimonadales bacterium]